jgi:hypothetical protein
MSPRPTQDRAVRTTAVSCHGLVRLDTQPRHVSAIHALWSTKKRMFSAWSGVLSGEVTSGLRSDT